MLGELAYTLPAGVLGGVVNAVAGGAKLFVFPLLMAMGLSPIAANVTAAVAMWPSQAPAAWVFRRELSIGTGELFRFMAPAMVGALFGAGALLMMSERAFVTVIPLLLALAVAAIVLGTRLRTLALRWVPTHLQPLLTPVLLFGCGVYGGYFGAGLGFMLLAVLGIAGITNLHRANAVKVLTVLCVSTVSVVPLALSGRVDWSAAGGVLLGGLIGGYAGAKLAKRMPERPLRWAVAVLGVVLTLSFIVR